MTFFTYHTEQMTFFTYHTEQMTAFTYHTEQMTAFHVFFICHSEERSDEESYL